MNTRTLAVLAAVILVGVVAAGVTLEQHETTLSLEPPVVITNGEFSCHSEQHNTIVVVQHPFNGATPYSAGASLGNGCTGTIAVLVVEGNGRDGVKVGNGAHDLEVLSGWIACGARVGQVHQDGVQAQGGLHVHFHNLHVDCPTGNNGAFFVNRATSSGGVPTDVTCTACDLLSGNAALNIGPDSLQSGARSSILRKGTSSSAPSACYRSQGRDPVNVGNVCLPPSPEIDTGKPVEGS